MADPRFFKNHGPFSVQDLAARADCEIAGASNTDKSLMITDVAPLDSAETGQVTFLSNQKYKHQLADTKASACVISEAFVDALPDHVVGLVSTNPYKSYALVAQAFYPLRTERTPRIHPTAVTGENTKIHESVIIGAHAVIGDSVEIGENTLVEAGVTLSHCIIGKNCRIFPGVRIGQDGFGFAIDPTGHVTVPQLGRVVIHDGVEIGANSTIDRGAGPDTVIGEGTRIDNLVQIGHNVRIGKGCVIVAQAGVAGSTVIEDYVVLAAQAGIAGHLTIGMGAQIGAKSGVPSDVPAGAKVIGVPAKPMKEFWREQVLIKRMVDDRKKKKSEAKS